MDQTTTLLQDYSDEEKGAYLAAIASLATADHAASQTEIGYLRELAEAAELSQEQEDEVVSAATNLSADDLNRHLDVLKGSDLKYSLVTDLISFAESDSNYSAEEKENIARIADYLDIDEKQYSALDQFVKKTAEATKTGEVSNPNFLSASGLQEKFQSAGLNMGSIVKGLIAIAGPIILAKMMSRKSGNSGVSAGSGSGGLGGLLGGGGLGGLLGGGLGSLLGGGSSGSSSSGSGGGLGGLLGGLFGGNSNNDASNSNTVSSSGGGGLGGLLGGLLGGGSSSNSPNLDTNKSAGSGGLGSIIGMLNGGRGFGGVGGLLGKILGK